MQENKYVNFPADDNDNDDDSHVDDNMSYGKLYPITLQAAVSSLCRINRIWLCIISYQKKRSASVAELTVGLWPIYFC